MFLEKKPFYTKKCAFCLKRCLFVWRNTILLQDEKRPFYAEHWLLFSWKVPFFVWIMPLSLFWREKGLLRKENIRLFTLTSALFTSKSAFLFKLKRALLFEGKTGLLREEKKVLFFLSEKCPFVWVKKGLSRKEVFFLPFNSENALFSS